MNWLRQNWNIAGLSVVWVAVIVVWIIRACVVSRDKTVIETEMQRVAQWDVKESNNE